MKVTLDGYRKIQQYKELGLSKAKTAEKMKISRFAVARWWDRTEDEFTETFRTSFMYLDSYKEFFLEQIRTYPCIRSTNLYYKTEEAFPDLNCTREQFFIYTLAKMYTSCEMESAMAHCIEADNCTIHELAAYLIYRYGERKARYQMSKHMFYMCRQRAQQMQREVL